jgi:hypothetical protein
MYRKLGVQALKLCAGVAAATLAVELLFVLISVTPLRWILPVPPVALYGPDRDTGYRHRADVSGLWLTENRSLIRTSNLGLRDRNRDLDHNGSPRAVVIGDSFVEALQVDGSETAAAVAERILSREHHGTEVANLGLAGARPAVEVARLQAEGRRLKADAAVVLLFVDNLLSPLATDDSEFTGYRRDADGEFRLSYGFRNSRGYRFRTSLPGRIYYWLLDHSQVARIINGLKNVGLFAELSPAPADEGSTPCAAHSLDRYTALWINGEPAATRAVFDAFIRDLAAIQRDNKLPIIVATRTIEAGCSNLAGQRAALIGAIRAQIEGAGLQFLDLDARIVAAVGADHEAELYGFGANLGIGHLNVAGNRVYGEIFADAIGRALPH